MTMRSTDAKIPEDFQLAAKFNRARISIEDFKESIENLQVFKPDSDQIIGRALLTTAIIAYARPFLSSRGGRGQATSRIFGIPEEVLLQEETELHNRVLELRNQAIAHSDFCRKSARRVGLASASGFVTLCRPFNVLSENIDATALLSMAQKWKQHCVSTLFDLNYQIESGRPRCTLTRSHGR